MKEKNRQRRLRLVAEAKKKPAVFTVYIILRLIVVAILVSSILRGEYENAAICLLVLFLFLLPLFVQKNFGIELPGTLEIIILVFIFASEILGELGCFFINVPNWDSILHTTTGFLCAAFASTPGSPFTVFSTLLAHTAQLISRTGNIIVSKSFIDRITCLVIYK